MHPPRLPLILLAITAVGCRATTLPEQPNMDATVEAYEAPTAEVNPEVAITAAEEWLPTVFSIFLLSRSDIVQDVVIQLQELLGGEPTEDPTGEPVIHLGPLAIQGDGFIDLDIPCSGSDADNPVFDGSNGDFDMTVVIRNTTIDQIVSGVFNDCSTTVSASDTNFPLLFNGGVAVNFGQAIRLDAPSLSQTILFDYFGEFISFDGEIIPDQDFRLTERGIEISFPSPEEDGNVLLLLDLNGAATGFRGSNGTFACNFEEQVCTRGGEPGFSW